MTANVFALLALLLACVPVHAHAQVYRCNAKDGGVAYQDRPCAQGQRQAIVDVPSHASPDSVSPPPASDAATGPATSAPVADARQPPDVTSHAPLPVMYACVNAVNGARYLARHPTAPYLAPLGVLGYPPQSLAQAYGTRGGSGVSAPELSKSPIGAPSIAAGMTEVEDTCLPARRAEVCAFVQREYDDNHGRLRAAVLPSEQKPLRDRERQLQEQLRNCR